ncbi:hypothetical protein ACHAWF_002885, partial [Thalassiosira exigua]
MATAAHPGLRRKLTLPSFLSGLIAGLLLSQLVQRRLAAPTQGIDGDDALAASSMPPPGSPPPESRPPAVEPPPRKRRRVLCAAMTGTSDYDRNRHVKIAESWGADCDGLVFLGWKANVTIASSVPRAVHAQIVTRGEDTHDAVGRKEFRTWRYLYERFGDEYDFFLKADTDTFVLVDHYRTFVERLDPDVPHYFGKQLTMYRDRTRHFVAGSSVSLSRAALARFGRAAAGEATDKDGRPFEECAEPHWKGRGHAGDVALSDCLWELGIYSMNTRDEQNRERFMNISPGTFAEGNGQIRGWWYEDMSFNVEGGAGCCAPDAIAWHPVNPDGFDRDRKP